MVKLKKTYKHIALLVLTSLLTACGTKQVEYQPNDAIQNNEIDNDVNEETIEDTVEETTEEVQNSTLDDAVEVEKTNDEIIMDYFNETKEQINNYLESENYQELKENVIQKFIIITDFLFYEGEIKGIKYSDLKEETKQNLLETYQYIDQVIMKKFPDYKENMSNKYENVKQWLNDKYTDNVDQDVREVINEITENDKETINSVTEYANGAYEKGKVKVKTWYEGLKKDYE